MSTLDDLSKIAELKEKGVLTSEEFEAEKRRILSRQDAEPADRSAAKEAKPAKARKAKSCRACKEEIARKASRCPHCGAKQGFGLVGTAAVLLCVSVVMSMAFKSSTPPKPLREFAIGDLVSTAQFELKIERVEVRSRVGDGMLFNSMPATGAKYLAVVMQITNKSSKPIGAFSLPSLEVRGTDGVRYTADVGASGSFGGEIRLDTKILSSLNPGVSTKRSAVFEVPESIATDERWKILVNADEDVYFLPKKAMLAQIAQKTQAKAAAKARSARDKQPSPKREDVASVEHITEKSPAQPGMPGQIAFSNDISNAIDAALASELPMSTEERKAAGWQSAVVNIFQGPENGVQSMVVVHEPRRSEEPADIPPTWYAYLWNSRNESLTPLMVKIGAKSLSLGQDFHNGARDLILDGLTLEWDGKQYGCASKAIRVKAELGRYVACLNVADHDFEYYAEDTQGVEGDLNADGTVDLVVPVYGTLKSGGNMTTQLLAAFVRTSEGYALAAELTPEGTVSEMRIESGQIAAKLTSYGPDDPHCCPTIVAAVKYTLTRNGLMQEAVAAVAPAIEPGEGSNTNSMQVLETETRPRSASAEAAEPSSHGSVPNRATVSLKAGSKNISPAFDSCMGSSRGDSAAILECHKAESLLQEKRLNVVYQRLRDTLSAEMRDRLKIEEREWLKQREKTCNEAPNPALAPEFAKLEGANCWLNITAARSDELEARHVVQEAHEAEPKEEFSRHVPAADMEDRGRNTRESHSRSRRRDQSFENAAQVFQGFGEMVNRIQERR